MSNTTPRAKPAARPSSPRGERAPASPRASPSTKAPSGDKEKKPKVKKVKGDKLPPTAPMSLEMPMHKVTDLNETQAKDDLQELQKKYGALIVNFNNQQAELARALKANAELESRLADVEAERGQPALSGDEAMAKLQKQLESAQGVRVARPCRCAAARAVTTVVRPCAAAQALPGSHAARVCDLPLPWFSCATSAYT